MYRKSVRNPEGFWEEVAEEHFQWRKKWDSVLEWDFSKPEISWFKGAQLNITENCIDRHLRIRGDKTAILFEPNDPNEEAEHITYRELHERVCKYANVLKEQGIKNYFDSNEIQNLIFKSSRLNKNIISRLFTTYQIIQKETFMKCIIFHESIEESIKLQRNFIESQILHDSVIVFV